MKINGLNLPPPHFHILYTLYLHFSLPATFPTQLPILMSHLSIWLRFTFAFHQPPCHFQLWLPHCFFSPLWSCFLPYCVWIPPSLPLSSIHSVPSQFSANPSPTVPYFPALRLSASPPSPTCHHSFLSLEPNNQQPSLWLPASVAAYTHFIL